MDRRLLVLGAALWLAGTAIIRVWGDVVLPAAPERIVALLIASAATTAWFIRRMCRRSDLPGRHWTSAAVSLLAPTLVLDPFSTAFFPAAFPGVHAGAAGVFGGWMLSCCAGALFGAVFAPRDAG